MACYICEMLERDLRDVSRALDDRHAKHTLDQHSNKSDFEVEIRALMSAKAEIEAKYSKHKSGPHTTT